MHEPTRTEAAAALQELEAARRAVTLEGRRGLPVVLTASSLLVVLDYTAKDHVPDPQVRRIVSALCVAGALTIALLDQRATPVQPISTDPEDCGPRAAAPGAALVLGWILAERALVSGLRRSRLRRPNTVAGLALAVLRPPCHILLMRLMPRPR